MQPDATDFEAQLSDKEFRAIDLILAGMNVAEIAGEVGVHRSTLYRWRQGAVFEAAVNRRRIEMRESISSRLEDLQAAAVSAVEAAITGGDGRLALAYLRAVGALSGSLSAIGSDDPERIERDRRAAERRAELFEGILDFDF